MAIKHYYEDDISIEVPLRDAATVHDMIEWCADNFGLESAATWRVMRLYPLQVDFRKEIEAMAFKLRWT